MMLAVPVPPHLRLTELNCALRDPLVVACLLGLCAVVVHLPAVGLDFVFDDIPAVVENPVVTGESGWVSAFTENYWGGRSGFDHVTTWRPLTTLSFRLQYALAGADPGAFHAVNVLLHGVVVGLVFLFLLALSRRRLAALVGGGLFAVLPVHVEAVAGIVNRAELLSAAFFLGASLAFVRAIAPEPVRRARWGLAALVLFALALLSKEHTVIWPFAMLVVWALAIVRFRAEPKRFERPRSPPAWLVGSALLVLLAYLGARAAVLPSIAGGDIPASDNPLVELGVGARLLTVAKVFLHYARQLVAPLQLSADYSSGALPAADSFADPDAFAGVCVVLLGLVALAQAVRRTMVSEVARLVAALFGLFLVLYALVSNLVFLSTILAADRLMYLPSLAYCGLVGVVVSTLWQTASRSWIRVGLAACAILVGLGYGVRSTLRVLDWRDAVTLFESSLEGFPGSTRARYNLGRELLLLGAVDEADAHLREVARLEPDDTEALALLGEIRLGKGDAPAALARFEAGWRARPDSRAAVNLCRATATLRRPDALDWCRQAVRRKPEDSRAHFYLGVALRDRGKLRAAAGAFQTALSLDPKSTNASRELARTRQALEHQPIRE